MHKINQKGFGVTGVMLLVAMLSVIGGVGYYVFSLQKAQDTTYNTTPENSSGNSKTNQSVGSDYLEIKEWNVKFKLTKTADRYSYEIEDRAGNSIALITNSQQVAVYKDCGVVIVERSKDGKFFNPAGGPNIEGNSSYVKQVGDFNYMKQSEQAACYDTASDAHNSDGTPNNSAFDSYESKLVEAGYVTDTYLTNLGPI